MSLFRYGVSDLRALYRNGHSTPAEVVESLLGEIVTRDHVVGSFLDVHASAARAAARTITDRGDYKDLPLGGIPVAIKDNICISGHPTTCASKILDGYHSPYDATVVEKLRAAGAIIMGKTNLDEFAMGSSTENSARQITRNPWNLEKAPGGSSGGSAAAVAAGFAPASLGSDTGGSIRQPASLCGVVGIKPTYGRISRYGLVAFASSLDQIGPMGRSVADVAITLGAICGHDPSDSTSVNIAVPDFTSDLDRGVDGLTVGVPWSFLAESMDAGVRENFEATVSAMKDAGATIQEIDLPHAAYGVAAYYIIANAEASANLARYDGVKYAFRSPDTTDLYSMYTRTRDQGFGEEVKRRILLGTYVLSAGYHDAYYKKAQQVRSLIIRDFDRVWENCDLVMSPTSPTPAFGLGEKMDDPITMYMNDVFTIPVNLAGLPGISVPSGFSKDRLPYGVQLIGKAMDEATVLRGAATIEAAAAIEERAFA